MKTETLAMSFLFFWSGSVRGCHDRGHGSGIGHEPELERRRAHNH